MSPVSPIARAGRGNRLRSWRFDEAVAKLLLAIQEDPSYPQPYRLLAACYAHMGRLDGARETIEQLRAIAPVVPDVGYLRSPEHRELFPPAYV